MPAISSAQEPLALNNKPAADTSALLRRALQLYDAGEYPASIDALSRVLSIDAGDVNARFHRALAYGHLASANDYKALVARGLNRPDEAEALERSSAEQYARMSDDLQTLLQVRLTDATAIIRLIDGVVRTKLAGLATGEYDKRIEARSALLAQARQAFEAYLHPPADSAIVAPRGLDRLRGEFFLAVVLYRQALQPSDQPGQPDITVDRAALDSAGELMASLANPASDRYVKTLLPDAPAEQTSNWLSYANLYLALIRTRQGNDDAVKGRPASQEQFSEAADFFKQAWKLDTGADYPQGEDNSGSGLIPRIATLHIPELEKALKAGSSAVENLYVDFEMGFAYDDNVVLQGFRSPLPSGVGKTQDFRFSTGTAVGYTLDLAKIDPSLDRWTVGAMGRASSSWHSDISEFNEQDYGGSVAIQYKALDAWSAGGQAQGPLYASVQYDYDYFLLGNEGYVGINRVTPQLTLYTHDQRAATSFGFRYEDRGYSEQLYSSDFSRSGNYFAFFVSESVNLVDMTAFYKRLGWQPWGLAYDPVDPDKYNPDNPHEDPTGYRRYLRPYVGFDYGWDSTGGTEFDANHYNLVAGLAVPLPYGVLFDFTGQWEWQDYYNRGSLVDSERRARNDLVQRYRCGFERLFVLIPGNRVNRGTTTIDRLVMSVRADVQFTDDDSNVWNRADGAVFSYDRAVWGLSVAFQFD